MYKYIRHIAFPVFPLLNTLSGSSSGKIYKKFNGKLVKITSPRYGVFKKSTHCVECGIEGKILAAEKTDPKSDKYHFNLYAIRADGKEILMTKDHIVPKSKGGPNTMNNYQTMCERCNSRKGNNIQ